MANFSSAPGKLNLGELWKTDGTSAGTIKLADVLSDGDFINFQGNLYFPWLH